jgi:hypothetical protein
MSKRAPTVPLPDLLKDGKVKEGDLFTWKRDIEHRYIGLIQSNGLIFCDRLAVGVPYRPSSFCELVALAYNPDRRGRMSGPNEGLVNGIPLVDIADQYRREHGQVTTSTARKR